MRIVGVFLLFVFCTLSVAAFFAVYRAHNKHSFSYDVILPTIVGESAKFNTREIKKKGRPYVVNVFASWCTMCVNEHKIWMEAAKNSSIDIYGIDYIDIESNALSWINLHGNPYIMVAADYAGEVTKTFGVSGVPETFIFNKKGELILHIPGVVTEELWKKHIVRLIR
ncbi:redoxin family protein [Candidatus Anaplasma sp. TIGMIC]|uniref:redoxin family protein n=1 Tax=Candidatus Anaplasma sp. TIGMIC TaxID=3020713 RepID=UPI002330AA55|nr:redoxin family protein [Candidatus Anaplasma sp. TIGMIC]MDB1135130.1 redoxin family protein [Candidatus Anaplasma sp. TIGMIC]